MKKQFCCHGELRSIHKPIRFVLLGFVYLWSFLTQIQVQAQIQTQIQTKRQDAELTFSQLLTSARLTAQRYANDARNQPEIHRRFHIQSLDRIIAVLSSAETFLLPRDMEGGNDWEYCQRKSHGRTLAYVNVNRSIHICRRAMGLSEEDLAQVLTHEAAHLVFDKKRSGLTKKKKLQLNECQATMWEMAIIKHGGGEPFANRHVTTCGLDSKIWGPFRTLQLVDL